MGKPLAIICLLASASLIHGCIFAGNKAKAAASDEDISLPGRQLKQFGGFPGIPGIPGGIPGIPGGGGGGGGNTGVSQSCGTVLATGGDPVLQPYAVSQSLKDCFIREARAWHGGNGNIFVAQFLRAVFHDCFTGKCDGSVFLTSAERAGAGNENLLAPGTIQGMRNRIRNNCNSRISYADAIRVGAATGVENLGGPTTSNRLTFGKRDSTVAESVTVLPKSTDKMAAQVALFQRVFRTTRPDAITLLVTLNGAHTIGVAACDTFRARKLNQDGVPAAASVRGLQGATCPSILDGSPFNCGRLPFDVTALTFDNSYFRLLLQNRGLLTSDQTMLSNRFCSGSVCGDNLVRLYARDQGAFFRAWTSAFLRLCSRTW